MSAARLRLEVACNDPDNGLFAHCAEQFQITTWDGQDIEFAVCREYVPRFAELPNAIRWCRRVWPVLASKEWYGNWCWNAYWLDPGVLVVLLEALKNGGAYHLDCGPSQLYENWNAAGRLNRGLWAANLWGRPSIGSAEAARNG